MGQIWDRKFPIPNLSHFRHNIKANTLRMYKNVYLLYLIHPVMIYHGLWVVCSNLPKYDFLRGDVLTYPFKLIVTEPDRKSRQTGGLPPVCQAIEALQ